LNRALDRGAATDPAWSSAKISFSIASFARIGQFITIAGENFDSVVGPGIVGSGNHDSGVEALRAGEEGDAGRCNHAGAARFDADGCEPLQEPIGNPATGGARVLTNDYPRIGVCAGEIVAQCAANPINAVTRQGKFTRDAANSVVPKSCLIGS